jgi:hypothetical protein
VYFFFLSFKGSSQIEIIYLEFPSSEEEVIEWKGDELKKMQNLKTLIVKNGSFSKGPKYFPNSLRVLEWPKYPSQVIPSDFFPKKLSICILQESDFTSFELCGTLKVRVNVMISFHYKSVYSLILFLVLYFAVVCEYERVKSRQMSIFNTNSRRL